MGDDIEEMPVCIDLDRAILEIEKNAKIGTEPDWKQLLIRFPQHARYIQDHFYLRRVAKDELPDFGSEYQIVKILGNGGQGRVFLAEQVELNNRRVAIKQFYDPKWKNNEMHALTTMRHPSIATLIEVGHDFVVMEYIEGKPITDFCETKMLSLRDRLSVFLHLCYAVEHCHDVGLLHRDLKPGNVLVQTCAKEIGFPQLVDFGLSDSVRDPSQFSFSGTVEYMSPEVLRGEHASYQSDVYALGIILCELLVGKRPVNTISTQEGMEVLPCDMPIPSKILQVSKSKHEIAANRKTQLKVLKAQMEMDLDWIVKHATAPDPAARFKTVAELANSVTIFLEGRINPDRFSQGRLGYACYVARKTYSIRRGFLNSVAIAVVLIIGVSIAFYYSELAHSQVLHRSESTRVTSESAQEQWRNNFNAKQLDELRSCEPDVFLAKVLELASPEYATLAPGLLNLQAEIQPETTLAERRDSIVRSVVTKQLPPTRKLQMILDTSVPDELSAIAPILQSSSREEQENLRSLLQSNPQLLGNNNSRTFGEFFLRLCLKQHSVDAESIVRSDREQNCNEIASRLCDTCNHDLETWCALFQTFDGALDKPLIAIWGNTRERASRRLKAVTALARLNRGEIGKLVEWLIKSPDEFVGPLLAELGTSRRESVTTIRTFLKDKPVDDASANDYVFAVCALAALDENDELWKCFKGDLGEAARCRAVVCSKTREIPLNSLIQKALITNDELELASLIEAIGFYSQEEADPNSLKAIVDLIRTNFAGNADAHVHAACLWTFRSWNLDIPQILPSSAIPSLDRQWFRSLSYMDFMTLTIPQKGKASDQKYRIAVSIKEISVADYSLFLELEKKKSLLEADKAGLFLGKKEVSPEMDCPQNSVSWTAAARFCNWLSEREGIESTQFCFAVDESETSNDGSRSRWVKEDYTTLRGYRMPTIEEAELIVRGLQMPFELPQESNAKKVVFPWGYDPKFLNEYAMTAKNAQGRTWPAGSRLPNRLGLFDTLGSLLEWTSCFDDAKQRAYSSGGNYINEDPSLFNPKPVARQFPDSTNFYFGLRIVRTIDTEDLPTAP